MLFGRLTRPHRTTSFGTFHRFSSLLFTMCMAVMLLAVPSDGFGQAVPTQNYAAPEPLTGLIQASDGNYYAVSTLSIYQITPLGVVTKIFTTTDSTTQGAILQPLVQGPDGALYGVTQQGGPNACNSGTYTYQMQNCGVFYKINLDGTGFTVLHNFNTAEVGYGLLSGALVLADDGNFYGTGIGGETNTYNLGSVFRVSPTGTASLVYSFTEADDDAPVGAMIQGTDGFLHGITQRNRNAGGYPITVDKDNGHLFRLSLSGGISNGYVLPADGSIGFVFRGTPVEGPDGTLYGGIEDGPAPNYPGVIYAAPPNGVVQTLYTMPIPGVNMQLAFGGDGNIYGGAYSYNAPATCTATNYYCGVEFQLTTAGAYTSLHAFVDATTGFDPMSNLLPAGNGDVLGTVSVPVGAGHYSGIAYDSSTALPAPVQLSFTQSGSPATTVPGGSSLTLNWKVLNAFSLSMQQCFAFPPLQLASGSTEAAGWTGKQTGTYTNAVLSGSATITAPSAAGAYVYALTCGGVESGRVTLTVGNVVKITTTSLPNATVSTNYNAGVQATGGVLPYHYGYSGTFPAGLQIDANTGFITGKPTQFGVYQVTVGVQDSSTPALIATSTLPLTIDSGLSLVASLSNGTVGTAYNATATATGGLGPYKWAVTSGSLPDGLTLNANSGAIAGTPTVASKYTFSIMVTDGEGKPATYTRAYTVSTMVPPLAIDEGILFNCTVNTLCQGQFTATGGQPPYTWAIAPGKSFPAGLTLNSNGSFSGKPLQYSAAGPYDLPVQVTDSENPPVQESGLNSLKVVSGLKIVSATLATATIGLPYTSPAPTASGGLPPYTWKALFSNAQVAKEYTVDPATGVLASSGPVTPGTYLVTYYVSDSEGNPDTVSQTANLVVNPATLTSSTTLSSSNASAGTGMNVVLTATVSSTGGATGVVTFLNGSTVLGTASLDSTGTASLTTSFSTAGVYQLTASYAGTATVTGSVSAALTETVVTPSLTASIAPGSLTLAAGSSGTLTLTITPTGGYTGTVGFSCGILPANTSCTFAPASLTLAAGSGPVTDVLTITTSAHTTAGLVLPRIGLSTPQLAAVLGFPGSMLALLGSGRKRRSSMRLLVLMVCFGTVAVLIAGCGSNGNTTPKGTYSIPVSLTLANGSAQTLQATVIVQ